MKIYARGAYKTFKIVQPGKLQGGKKRNHKARVKNELEYRHLRVLGGPKFQGSSQKKKLAVKLRESQNAELIGIKPQGWRSNSQSM